MIVPEKDFEPDNTITGVTSQKHFSALYLHKYLLNKEAGFTLRICKFYTITTFLMNTCHPELMTLPLFQQRLLMIN